MAAASRFNRGYSGGLAAGSPPGGGFGSSFQSSFQSSMSAPSFASVPKPKADGYSSAIDWGPSGQPEPWQAPQPPSVAGGYGGQAQPQQPDMGNMFGPAPLPGVNDFGSGPPPPGLGQPAPLPFGGFRARGGPVLPGRAYMVGEGGKPEMFVPQEPGMIIPNDALVPRGSTGSMGMPQIPGNTQGMLIPGSSPGAALWAPGNAPAGRMPLAPPQQPMLMPQAPASLTSRASASDGAVRTGPLSERGAVPVGRGMTPGRRMEMFARRAWTRGDEGAAMGITGQLAQMDQRQQMQQQGMDFAAKQNETNFQQGLMMQGMQQGAQFQRDEMQRQQQLDDWQRNQAAAAERDTANFQQGLTMFGLNQGAQAMDAERQRQQQEQDRMRVPNISVMPVPNTDYVMPTADGRVMGTLPVSKPDAPLPPGMPQPGKPATMPKFQQDTNSGKMFYVVPNDKGGFTRKWVDEDGNGTVSAAEQSKATAAAPASSFLKSFGR